MKHHDSNRKLGRERKSRTALKKSLVRSLVLHESIETTEAKAKEIAPQVEKLITKSKINTLASRRVVSSALTGDRKLVAKMFDDIALRYKDRSGGYTRIIRTGNKADDARKMAKVQLV
jgi:large subunit ribosomal protein L17